MEASQFAPFDLLLFHTLKHKDDRLVISVVTATSSLAYVGTRDGKLLVYEYQTGVDVRKMPSAQVKCSSHPLISIRRVSISARGERHYNWHPLTHQSTKSSPSPNLPWSWYYVVCASTCHEANLNVNPPEKSIK